MSSLIQKEVKNLRERLGQVRDEVTQRRVDFSQQAVQLQNLLITSKTGLTGNKGRTNFLTNSIVSIYSQYKVAFTDQSSL